MNQTTKWIIGAIIVVAVIAVGYSIYKSPSEPVSAEPIKIGALLPLSGPAAYYGDQSKKGIEIAKEEILEEYPNLKLELYYEDSLYTPKGGVDAYQKLRNTTKLDAVITAASPVSLAIAPLTIEDKILQMAIFSSADKYTSPDDLTFRVSTRSEVEAQRMAEFIKNEQYKKLAIFYLNNDFGVSFKEALKNKLGDSAEIVTEEGYLLETNDFRTQLLKIKQFSPDAIFMVGIAKHYATILKQANEAALKTQFLSTRSAEDPVLLQSAAEFVDGLTYTYPFDAAGEDYPLIIKQFTEKFKAKYGNDPDAYAAEGYEGFKLTALPMIECRKSYQCVESWLKNLKDKNYISLFGKISFDRNGDVYYDYFLKTVKDGQFVRHNRIVR